MPSCLRRFVSSSLLMLAFPCVFLQAAEPTRTAVFTSGKEGYHTFRIPALLVTQKGTLLAFCEGRKTSRSDHGDLDLVLKRSSDGGKSWGPLELVYEEGDSKAITIGNPCPVVDRTTGVIWLLFCRDNRDVLVTFSKDDGKTWAKPKEITQATKRKEWGWYATGPGVGIQLRHGKHKERLVIPCDHRQRIDGKEVTFSHTIHSDDHGKSWQLGGTVAKHTNECQVVELGDGALMLNMRNVWGRDGKAPSKGRMRAVSMSKNGGETWGELTFDKTLIEPICQASLLRYGGNEKDGKPALLFSNPASKTKRHRLTVRLSRDEGQTWPTSLLIHSGPSAYSCLANLPSGDVGCLYEGGSKHAYQYIYFTRFPLTRLLTGK